MPGTTERRQVEAMADYGVSETDIARVLQIDPKTLRKHYREELDTGHILANAKVAESLFRKATGDGPKSVTAAIFWLKTRAGWTEARWTMPGGLLDAGIASTNDERIKADADRFRQRVGLITDCQKVDDIS